MKEIKEIRNKQSCEKSREGRSKLNLNKWIVIKITEVTFVSAKKTGELETVGTCVP